MDYGILGLEIVKPAYAGMSNQQIADALNAMIVSVPMKIQMAAIKKYLFLNDLLLPVQAAALKGEMSAVTVMAALTAFDTLDTDEDAVRAKVTAVLAALVTDNILKQADQDAILGLAVANKPWTVFTLNVPLVTDYDVSLGKANQ